MAGNRKTSNSSILFFKIITRASLEAGKLVIPNDFTKLYSSAMSNPVFLKLPDGKEWKVFWEKHDGYIWFHKGWKEFTSYYSLDHGHLLLFDFKDTSHFDVLIFDNENTLEIKYHMIHGNQDEQNNNPDEIMSDKSVEISDELPPSKKSRQKSPMSHSQPHRHSRSHISKDVGSSSKVQNFPKQDKSNEKRGRSSGLKHLAPRITETSKRASTSRSKNSSFKVGMKSSYFGGYRVHGPSYLAEKYLKNNEGGHRRTRHGNQDEQNDNLDQIMSDSSIEVLDELPPSKKSRKKSPMPYPQPHRHLRSYISGDVGRTSKVQKFPKQVKIDEKRGSRSGLEHLAPEITETSKRDSTSRSKNSSFKEGMKPSYVGGYRTHGPSYSAETYLKKNEGGGGRTWHVNQDEQNNNFDHIMSESSVEILDELPPSKKTRKKSPMSHPQPHRYLRSHISGDVGRSSKVQNFPKQVKIKEKMGCSSRLDHLAPKVIETSKRASTLRSKNPYFKVEMRPSYIGGYYMYVPTYFTEIYLKNKNGDVVLEVLDGRTWHGSLDFGKIRTVWKQFVLDNNLKAGDVCHFELIKKRPLTFKVLINIPPTPQDV